MSTLTLHQAGGDYVDAAHGRVLGGLDKLEDHCRRSPLYAWSKGLTHLDYFPPILYIAPTNGCSHRCFVCPHKDLMRKGHDQQGNRQQGLLSWERLKAIVADIPPEVARIYFYKQGEPLLHPEYVEMASYIRSKVGDSVDLAMSTNATHLTKEKVVPLMETFSTMVFSLYALDRPTFAALHGKDNFERVIRNLEYFHQQYQKHPNPRTKVYLNFVRQKGNAHLGLEEVEAFFAQRFPAFNNAVHGVFNWGGHIDEGNYAVLEEEDRSHYPVCIFPWSVSVVLWDGWMAPCIVDIFERDRSLGRAPKTSLRELVNHPGAVQLRGEFARRDFQALAARGLLCAQCNWLFQLRAQSTSYAVLHTQKIADSLEVDTEGLEVGAEEIIHKGFCHYLRGQMDKAAGAFVFAQEVASRAGVRDKATLWLDNVRQVLRQRGNLERWEAAFNSERLSLRDAGRIIYFEGKEKGRVRRQDTSSL